MMLFGMIGIHAQAQTVYSYPGRANLKFIVSADGKTLTIDGNYPYNSSNTDASFDGIDNAHLFPNPNGTGKFSESSYFTNVETINLKNLSGNLQSNMFTNASNPNVKTINVYTSVGGTIKMQCFQELHYITTVNIVIDDINHKTRTVDGRTGGFVDMEKNGFMFDEMVVQTSIANFPLLAQLNLPSRETIPTGESYDDYYEYYIGHWKDGAKFTQAGLNDVKDGGTIGSPQNGWQQFAKSGTNQIVLDKDYIGTYSSDVAYKRPSDFKVYLVIGYNQSTNQLEVAEIDYIPANTGVLLRALHTSSTNDDYMTYFELLNDDTKPSFGFEEQVTFGGNTYKNYLHKSLTDDERAVGPVERDASGKIAYRLFGFTTADKYGASFNNPKFVRLKNSTAKKNKAYLKLPATMFTKTNEGTDGPGKDSFAKQMSFYNSNTTTSSEEDNVTAEPTIDFDHAVVINTGAPCTVLKEIEPVEIEGETTSIKNVQLENYNKIYNLQGLEVKGALKGVYIKNGKKYIVK